ncbi:MAG: J domain-containing protein [Ktedonobacteraceae bacterium]
MTEEEKLAKAYFILGLEPGAPLDKITRRHKRLIMVWHPDRFPTEDGKKEAEEELKNINNAKDDLKNHFEKSHKAS